MSTFKSVLTIAEHPGTTIEVVASGDRVGVIVHDSGAAAMVKLDPANAPAIALAVLEAAGVEARDLTAWTRGRADDLSKIAFDLTEHVRCAKIFAAAAAKEAARDKRRDELAKDFWGGRYDELGEGAMRAVDSIVELELAKERAMGGAA